MRERQIQALAGLVIAALIAWFGFDLIQWLLGPETATQITFVMVCLIIWVKFK